MSVNQSNVKLRRIRFQICVHQIYDYKKSVGDKRFFIDEEKLSLNMKYIDWSYERHILNKGNIFKL